VSPKNTPDAGLRGQVVQALITHSITESNGGRPPLLRPSLLPPFVREKVEGNAASRADAVMDVVAPALAAKDARIAKLEAEVARLHQLAEHRGQYAARADSLERALREDREADDAELAEQDEELRKQAAEIAELQAQLAAPVTSEARRAAIEAVLTLIIAKHQPDLDGHCGTGDGPAIRQDATDYVNAALEALTGGA